MTETPTRPITRPTPRPAYNAAGLRARCGGDDDLVRDIAAIFVAECPGYVARLRAALRAGDGRAAGVAAHTLKGAVGNLSAGAAFAVAQHLDELARAGRIVEA